MSADEPATDKNPTTCAANNPRQQELMERIGGSQTPHWNHVIGNQALDSLWIADSDEVARAFRDDVARCSDMMSPGVRCLAGG